MKILVTRPLVYRGAVYVAGTTIDADANAAGELVASGRAELVDAADAEHVQGAIAEQRDRLLDTLNAAQQRNAAELILRRRQRA